MAKRSLAPALADLRQDIAGVVPVDLIRAWADSAQDEEAHARLLAPHVVRGTVVCSDSAGLSRLSKTRPLLDVLKLVQEPKEIIHAYGAALGGVGIGVWTADNTEMFYPDPIDPADVIAAMAAAQREAAACEVKVGLGIRHGAFVQLGGGLFGMEADLVEHVAEDHTAGGEIVLMGDLGRAAEARWPGCTSPAADIPWTEPLFRLDVARAVAAPAKDQTKPYPAPFDPAFAAFLNRMPVADAERETFLTPYLRQSHVVFLKVRHAEREFLLDQLADWIAANAVVSKLSDAGVDHVKCNGDLGIFLAPDAPAARTFALALRRALADEGFTCNVGVSAGDSLVFPLPRGLREIAGSPVNLASKLSEEMAEYPSSIHILDGEGGEPFSAVISGVELRGVRL